MNRRKLLYLILLLGGCGPSGDLQNPDPPAEPNPQPQIDLSAGAIEAPERIPLDSLLEMRIGVRNGGPVTAGPGWFIRVFLSADQSIAPEDILIEQFVATRELPPGTEDRYLRHMKLPGSIDPGRYYLGSMLDVTQIVPETNEQNNTLPTPATISILPRSPSTPDGPDGSR
jgi:hypothetical protein